MAEKLRSSCADSIEVNCTEEGGRECWVQGLLPLLSRMCAICLTMLFDTAQSASGGSAAAPAPAPGGNACRAKFGNGVDELYAHCLGLDSNVRLNWRLDTLAGAQPLEYTRDLQTSPSCPQFCGLLATAYGEALLCNELKSIITEVPTARHSPWGINAVSIARKDN